MSRFQKPKNERIFETFAKLISTYEACTIYAKCMWSNGFEVYTRSRTYKSISTSSCKNQCTIRTFSLVPTWLGFPTLKHRDVTRRLILRQEKKKWRTILHPVFFAFFFRHKGKREHSRFIFIIQSREWRSSYLFEQTSEDINRVCYSRVAF